jgi:hypothetical protein
MVGWVSLVMAAMFWWLVGHFSPITIQVPNNRTCKGSEYHTAAPYLPAIVNEHARADIDRVLIDRPSAMELRASQAYRTNVAVSLNTRGSALDIVKRTDCLG